MAYLTAFLRQTAQREDLLPQLLVTGNDFLAQFVGREKTHRCYKVRSWRLRVGSCATVHPGNYDLQLHLASFLDASFTFSNMDMVLSPLRRYDAEHGFLCPYDESYRALF